MDSIKTSMTTQLYASFFVLVVLLLYLWLYVKVIKGISKSNWRITYILVHLLVILTIQIYPIFAIMVYLILPPGYYVYAKFKDYQNRIHGN